MFHLFPFNFLYNKPRLIIIDVKEKFIAFFCNKERKLQGSVLHWQKRHITCEYFDDLTGLMRKLIWSNILVSVLSFSYLRPLVCIRQTTCVPFFLLLGRFSDKRFTVIIFAIFIFHNWHLLNKFFTNNTSILLFLMYVCLTC